MTLHAPLKTPIGYHVRRNKELWWSCQRPGCSFVADKNTEVCADCRERERDPATRQGIFRGGKRECHKRGPIFTLNHVGKRVTFHFLPYPQKPFVIVGEEVYFASLAEMHTVKRHLCPLSDSMAGEVVSVTNDSLDVKGDDVVIRLPLNLAMHADHVTLRDV